MSEQKHLIIQSSTNDISGDIVIAPEVMEIIIGIAASKVEGVHAMQGSIVTNVNELFGRKAHGKGVSLTIGEDGALIVDLDCYVNYGVSVPKVASEMQDKVKQQVLYMTDLTLDQVNVHVVGMIPEENNNHEVSSN